MKKLLGWLLPFEKYTIRTKSAKEAVLQQAISVGAFECESYYSRALKNGFVIAEKTVKAFLVGRTQNSFAPVAHVKMREEDGLTVLSVLVRMRVFVCAIFLPLYLLFLLTFLIGITELIVGVAGGAANANELADLPPLLLPWPILQAVFYIAFKRPAKRMKELLYTLVSHE
ncbi:MAG: hypothetical protein IJW51_06290 [Clostridia bacterium]|nr:hypothetical protein [Clostridia bacterium]